jgi:hypothetical protein
MTALRHYSRPINMYGYSLGKSRPTVGRVVPCIHYIAYTYGEYSIRTYKMFDRGISIYDADLIGSSCTRLKASKDGESGDY